MTNEMGIECLVNTFLLERRASPQSPLHHHPTPQSLWKSSQLSDAFPHALRRERVKYNACAQITEPIEIAAS